MISSTATDLPGKAETITFSIPTLEDGRAMWELVDNSTLDQNSVYKYLLMSEFYAETCVVAKERDKLVGFVTALIPPNHPDVVFVWQIGVDSSQRGKGIASKLLNELMNRPACADVHYLEATVTPSNEASQSLFKGMAREHQTNCKITERFSDELFPSEDHEEELNFRIGPFKK
ncbi:diaminobutyrate acetyltransferase [Halobacillus salinarum]|uniref:L-2,4-diaminobutyric acid acetyltransferase n=1 Tax=Halobacillus salinarum TaxID=2932257 RepID=A0ABY4EKN9_9BACI|nr:diaminobutyrate acetyltransferase [Halobacillus salinarum]UOQ45039.1 diaminobutyrate acetyltransferase [Halobacillus salinarum]